MYVYFILSYIAVKIGKDENVEERRENLQTANPDELIIHRKIRIPENISAKTVETALHKLAEKYHKRGEWFYLKYTESEAFRDCKEPARRCLLKLGESTKLNYEK